MMIISFRIRIGYFGKNVFDQKSTISLLKFYNKTETSKLVIYDIQYDFKRYQNSTKTNYEDEK